MSADIGHLRVGQAPQGIIATVPAAPAPAAPPPLQPVPVKPILPVAPAIPAAPVTPSAVPPPAGAVPIVIPPTTSGGGLARKLFIIAGIIILGAIVYAVSALFGGSGPEPIASESPSPAASPTEKLTGKSLRSYLGYPTATIAITDQASALEDFKNGLITVQPATGVVKSVSVTANSEQLSADAFLKLLLTGTPAALTSSFGTDWLLLAYGQTERFDETGAKVVVQGVNPKAVFISEVNDASAANQAMSAWESQGLASAGAGFLGYDVSKRIVTGFSDGSYRSIPIRYWNFPYADVSIDYAIALASNNKSYLIISSSRESLFFVIDQLMQ